jgi:glycerol-3-phosphate acyltransferase PlsY
MIEKLVVLIISYLIGSFPTALVYSKAVHGQDIRYIGDGNIGARNTTHQFGTFAGIIVGVVDISKGVMAMILASAFQLPLVWQLAAGAASILGHDFSIFARFSGGKGLATTTGVFLVLFPTPALIGGALYGAIYYFFHHSDLAASISMGVYVLLVVLMGAPLIAVCFIVIVLFFVPLKKWLDKP